MPLLRNRMLPLRTITLRYVARNVELFWKEEWDSELLQITETSDDILLDLPSVIRWETFLLSSKNDSLNTKALLLLLDHKSLSEDLEYPLRERFNELDMRNVMTLLARRCKKSTSLSLSGLAFVKEPSFGEVLGNFTKLTTLKIYEADCVVLKVIGTSLHNLKQLYLDNLKNDNFDDIKCLVIGCPKLKILHVEEWLNTLKFLTNSSDGTNLVEHYRTAPLESVQYLLLGLPNLIEFKHPLMAVALEKIIQDGRADRVSSLRTLYIGDGTSRKVGATDVYNSTQVVINHLIHITKLTIIVPNKPSKELLKNLSETVSTMSCLTELSWRGVSYSDITCIVPIVQTLGQQLRLLDLWGRNYYCFDMIDQCRELRVLRIVNIMPRPWKNNDPSYGSDLYEQFTPFQHLQELHLNALNHSSFKPALLKSLIASPVLQDLKLESLPNFTDHIMKAAFCHMNEEGEQMAFTSLHKLELCHCHSIANYLENVVTHERVPLEMITIKGCSCLTGLWNMERFDLTFNDLKFNDLTFNDLTFNDDEDDYIWIYG